MGITREGVLEALRGKGRPALSAAAIRDRLARGQGKGGRKGKALRALLESLVAEGAVELSGRRYRLARRDGLVEGTWLELWPEGGEGVSRGAGAMRGEGASQGEAPALPGFGRGRVVDDAGGEWSVTAAVPVAPGDRVLLESLGGEVEGRRQGQVLDVVEGSRSNWVGILGREGRGSLLTPYRDSGEWRVRIAGGDRGAAADGEVVVVVPVQGRKRRGDGDEPWGRVVERLGRPGEPEADFRAVVWRHRLPVEFSAATLAEAKAASPGIGAKEFARRVDLRDRPFVTIDPPDARDHDDAVYVEAAGAETEDAEKGSGGKGRGRGRPTEAEEPGGIRLWVAIADVSHYVAEGSALDAEALYRGNSVYFPDRSIPMLPERLSGDLCSLRPDVDRLALVVELLVDRKGAATRSSFYPAVIRSRAKLHYAQAAAVMEAAGSEAGLAALQEGWDAGAGPPDPAWVGQLRLLARLAQRLMERRFAQGSIDFDLPTGEIVLDEEGMPHDVVESERTLAHRAVEEAMLAANRAVAKALESSGLPAIYRCHEEPSPEKLAELRELLESFGLVAARRSGAGSGGGRGSRGGRGEGGRKARAAEPLAPLDISRALLRAAGRPEERLVNLVTLRSMRQARYEAENRGHFALGFERYLHFTSPIRRYADLVVHRRLKQLMAGEVPPARAARMVERVASRISFRERLAVQAEREMADIKRCAFMQRHVGEEFEGSISGVARHGIYVTLDAFYVDGLLPLWSMPEYMELDAGQHAFVGRSSGRRYRLGDPLRIRVEEVDIAKGWIRFVLAGTGERSEAARGGKARSGARRKSAGKGRSGGKAKRGEKAERGKKKTKRGKKARGAREAGRGSSGRAEGGRTEGGRTEKEGERSGKPVRRGGPAKSRARGRGAPTRGRDRR